MAIRDLKIISEDIQGKDIAGLPDRPSALGYTATQLKARFDAIPKALLAMGRFNRLIDELEALSLDKVLRSDVLRSLRLSADGRLEVSADGLSWQTAASGGHIVLGPEGTALPQRTTLRFTGCAVRDDSGTTVVDGVTGPTGPRGERGGIAFPALSDEGVLSWGLNEGSDLPAPRSLKGPQGVQGLQGPSGLAGPQGPAGPQGEVGNSGERGERGDTGAKGDAGEPGPKGNPGATGERGATGDIGTKGDTGARGEQGEKGELGDRGADGRSFSLLGLYPSLAALQAAHPTGSPGDAYAVGTTLANSVYVWSQEEGWLELGPLQGPAGPRGEIGPAGVSGELGAIGPRGLQGPQGLRGEQGEAGGTGERGPAGTLAIGQVTAGETASVINSGSATAALLDLVLPRGERGVAGPQGEVGAIGPAGATGPVGAQGVQGTQGERGPVGPEGTQGQRGLPAVVNGRSGESITLTATDVGARAASWLPTAAQVGAVALAGGTLAGALAAAPSPADGLAQVRNMVVVAAGTDPATLSVPVGTLILVRG